VIVREKNGGFVLVEQHEHGKISGEFARHWNEGLTPLESTLYAIVNHDVAWRELDRKLSWNPETGSPYTFIDYPLVPKLEAYTKGIDLVESHSPYAGCLCSMHYASFVKNFTEEFAVSFKDSEERRQERLKRGMGEDELANLGHNFRLLQLCDDLSLFVCLNEPGRNDFPWYRQGFKFEGERILPVWEDEGTLRFEPQLFTAPFEISIPYQMIDGDGNGVEEGSIALNVL
jgi:hypothetical protein